ncbi:hypothetical protein LJK88_06015 [Paenibacillus sp. P26]|nr:hypothetical protein LJK88_06015 [Paenibacillus sp. P26]
MRRLNKKAIPFLVLATTMLMTSACGGTTGTNSNAAAPAGETKEAPKAGEPVKIIWWHAMGGELGKAVDKLVADFNASQKNYVVEPVFQGSYDENLNKLKASLDSNSGPTMVQMYEIG